jgi:hypothetical protein
LSSFNLADWEGALRKKESNWIIWEEVISLTFASLTTAPAVSV